MSGISAPTPPELDCAPELAVLAVLELCVESATHAVVAEQPALRSGDPDNNPPRGDSYSIALALVHAGDELLRAIRAYRAALELEHQRDQDDYPF